MLGRGEQMSHFGPVWQSLAAPRLTQAVDTQMEGGFRLKVSARHFQNYNVPGREVGGVFPIHERFGEKKKIVVEFLWCISVVHLS